MHANIDGDVLIYRSGFAVERTCYRVKFSDGSLKDLKNSFTRTKIKSKLKSKGMEEGKDYELFFYKLYEPVENALFVCRRQIESILEATKATSHTIFLSANDGSNFRYAVAKIPGPHGAGYKAGRPEKPKYYEDIRNYLLEEWEADEIFEMEADDALGIYQTEDTIACHQDKDIDMIPGNHYNFVTKEFYNAWDVGELYLDKNKIKGVGVKWFYAQLLLGDNTDNIPGVKRYGPKTVYNLLKDLDTEEELLSAVWKVYKKKFKKEALDRIEEVANLLWILRTKEDNKGLEIRHKLGVEHGTD